MPDNTEQHDGKAFTKLLRSVGSDTTPTPGFEERLLRRLLAEVKAQESRTASKAVRSLKHACIRIAPAVAAAVLLAIAFWWLFVGSVPPASADFAEMLRRVRQARSVAFDAIYHSPGQPEDRAKVCMADPGRTRIDWPDGRVHIYRAAERRLLDLWPAQKKATLRITDLRTRYHRPLEILQRAAESAGQFVRKETWHDGRKVLVYKVIDQKSVTQVWVDHQQGLPTRIQTTFLNADGQETGEVLEDKNFRWNEPIDDCRFSLKVPAGYTSESREDDASEESLLSLLLACAEMSKGSFPAKLDARTVLDLILADSRWQAYQRTVDSNRTITVMDDQAKEAYRSCRRGLAFVERVKENGNWQYVGGGKELGDETAVVCWWKLPGTPTFRAVYGNLEAKDVTADKLPSHGEHFGSSERPVVH